MATAPRMRTGALAYFAIVLGWSSFFWLSSSALGYEDPARSPVFLIGGAGPLIAALALIGLCEARETQRDFVRRILDPRRIGPRWWGAALLLHPALVALAVAVDLGLGAPVPVVAQTVSLAGLPSLAFFVFWFGPLPEEIGWRGFALDRLLVRTTPLRASLVLGVVWGLWHVPLFFVPGTFQAELGVDSVRFWIFMTALLPLSVLMTWIYEHTERSTLSAALVHFSGNLVGALIVKSDRLAALELGMLSLAAVLVTLGGGLTRERADDLDD